MLSTDKIKNAFTAICEEVEKLENVELDDETRNTLNTIRSIAKHQSDIREAKKGSCKASQK